MSRKRAKQGILDRLFPGRKKNRARSGSASAKSDSEKKRKAPGYVRTHFWGWVGTFCFWSALIAIIGGGGYALSVSDEIAQNFEGHRSRLPSKVYSDSLTLLPGQNIEILGLVDRLHRLNYQQTDAKVLSKGEFRVTDKAIDIHLRDFTYPQETERGYWLRIVLSGLGIARLENVTERREIYSAEIEPELIARFFGQQREEREPVTLAETPPTLVNAILAIEDKYFYLHPGVNPVSTVRALASNALHGGGRPGGSTITQQLVKNVYLTHERTVARKLKEMVRAFVLEMIYDKDQILEAYLNEIYFGQSGSVAICGAGEAARFYFQKDVQSLDLAESATLAALIQNPGRHNPRKQVERARRRRDLILSRMLEQNLITREQHDAARRLDIHVATHNPSRTIAPYFVDFLRDQLIDSYTDDVLTSDGLRIFTTLDTSLQGHAERSLQDGITRLEKAYTRLTSDPKNPLQAAILVIQPQTGYIRAMMGGRSYRQTQLNRVVNSRRQPGSIFKPIVYLAGFERSVRDRDFRFTAIDEVADEPFDWTYDNGRQSWSPKNFANHEYGTVTVRTGLEKSINRVTAKLAQKIGLDRVLETAEAIGISQELPPYPSVVLGAIEVSPLEIAQAFTTLAGQGSRSRLFSIRDVVDAEGNVLEKKSVKVRQVVSPQAAYLTTSLMQGVFTRGTATSASRYGFSHIAAGKTGTTSDSRDAWFLGYTPDLLAVVWVGFDKKKGTGLTGASGALPIWAEFMSKALAGQTDEEFPIPPGVVVVDIDRECGMLANYDSKDVIAEAFLEGTEPTEECPTGKDPIIERFKDFFNTDRP